MKKAMLVKMMVALVTVALVAGCAGTGKGPTDQELVNLKVKAFTDALSEGEPYRVAAERITRQVEAERVDR